MIIIHSFQYPYPTQDEKGTYVPVDGRRIDVPSGTTEADIRMVLVAVLTRLGCTMRIGHVIAMPSNLVEINEPVNTWSRSKSNIYHRIL